MLYDINKILKNLNAFFFGLEKKNLPYLYFQLTHRPIFLVTTQKIFFSSPVQTEKKDNIHAISVKTSKTAVLNTNTHIYKMKRKKKDRKK